MTIEQQVRAIFGIPDDKMVTPIGVTMEFESMIARLDIKKREIQKLYDKYMSQVESEDSAEEDRTITMFTRINELGFSEKCVKAFEKKNIYKLGDLKNVTRNALVDDKAIGSDNAARVDRIIAPLDVYYKKTEDYQSVGEEIIDDSILEETDNNLNKELKNSDKSIKNDISAKLKAEIKEELTEELTTELRNTICQNCEYRLATCENSESDIPTSDINTDESSDRNAEYTASKTVKTAENAVDTVENNENSPVGEVLETEKVDKMGEKPKKRRTRRGKKADKPTETDEIPFELDGDLEVKPYEETEKVDEKAAALEEWEKTTPFRGEDEDPEFRKPLSGGYCAEATTGDPNYHGEISVKNDNPYDTKFEMADTDDDFDFSAEEKDDELFGSEYNSAEKASIEIDEKLDEESVESDDKHEEPIEAEKPVEKLDEIEHLPFVIDGASMLDDFEDGDEEPEAEPAETESYDKAQEDAMFERFEDIIDMEQEKETKKTAKKESKPAATEEETGVVEEVDIGNDFDDFPDDLF